MNLQYKCLNSYLSINIIFQMKGFPLHTEHFRWFHELPEEQYSLFSPLISSLNQIFIWHLPYARLLDSSGEDRHSIYVFKLCPRISHPKEVVLHPAAHYKLLLARSLMTSALLNPRTDSQPFPCFFKVFDVHSSPSFILEVPPSLGSLDTILYRLYSLLSSQHSFPVFLAAFS